MFERLWSRRRKIEALNGALPPTVLISATDYVERTNRMFQPGVDIRVEELMENWKAPQFQATPQNLKNVIRSEWGLTLSDYLILITGNRSPEWAKKHLLGGLVRDVAMSRDFQPGEPRLWFIKEHPAIPFVLPPWARWGGDWDHDNLTPEQEAFMDSFSETDFSWSWEDDPVGIGPDWSDSNWDVKFGLLGSGDGFDPEDPKAQWGRPCDNPVWRAVAENRTYAATIPHFFSVGQGQEITMDITIAQIVKPPLPGDPVGESARLKRALGCRLTLHGNLTTNKWSRLDVAVDQLRTSRFYGGDGWIQASTLPHLLALLIGKSTYQSVMNRGVIGYG